MANNLVYDVHQRPPFGKNLVFAFQQMIAIMAATLLVPILISGTPIQYEHEGVKYVAYLTCDPAAAFFGAGLGTIVYLLFTRFKSPVFLGSSFTFLGALCAAATSNFGYWGLIIGVAFAGLVYVTIAVIIKLVGSGWIKKLLPHVIIGPILAIIGLSLSGTAGSWMMSNGGGKYSLWYVFVGLFTFAAIVIASVKGGKGVSSTCGVMLMTFWWQALICYVITIALIAITKFVSLGSLALVVLFGILVTATNWGNWLVIAWVWVIAGERRDNRPRLRARRRGNR